ncbi:MAG: carboxyl transferase domain-containing protein [Eubacteriales bacterium]|nr:carboxyl transferase domain-containing protein [Eubacteriales bacterium]
MENKNLSTFSKALDKACSKIKSFVNDIVDAESFVETDAFLTGKGFDSALEALGEGVITGYATIQGHPVHLFAQNAEVLKGSMSQAQADKIAKAMQRAVSAGVPFVSIIDCSGARVGEGAAVLESYAQLIADSAILADNVPHVAIVKGVAVGMMATYVAGADFVFMSKDAIMSVNSPMYLASDVKNFPINYTQLIGYDNYAKSTDLAQFIYKDSADLSSQLARLFATVLPADEEESEDDPNRIDPALDGAMTAAQRTESICDKGSVITFNASYAPEVVCSLAKINGISVGVIATEGDYISQEGVEKATDFIDKLESFDLPLVTLVDTLGVNPTLEQELSGFAKKTNRLMQTIAASSIAKIGVAVGNAVGFGYSALMSKGLGFGYTLACERSVISPIPSDTAVVAMMNEQLKEGGNSEELRARLSEKYQQMQANPLVAAKDGYIDNVIEACNIRPYVSSALLMLLGL